MNIDRVLNGVVKYMDREILSSMNDWQEFLARLAMARLLGNKNLESMLLDNPYVKTFAIIDENGNVDVDGLHRDFKMLIQNKGKIEIALPMFGTYTFNESDVDKLFDCIRGS
jgi:hypothetical protein